MIQSVSIGHDLAESQDEILLKRRARRRLVGAIALVVFTVIVLPLVFDQEPRSVSQDLVISIPSQDSRFTPRTAPADRPASPGGAALPVPAAGVANADPLKATPKDGPAKSSDKASGDTSPNVATRTPANEPTKDTRADAAKAPGDQAVSSASKASPGAATTSAAPAQAAEVRTDAAAATAQRTKKGGEQFVVALGAYTNRENIKQLQAKASAAGFRTYTEKTPKGDQLRVRAGPFSSREAAEQARQKLASRGLPAGAVAPQ